MSCIARSTPVAHTLLSRPAGVAGVAFGGRPWPVMGSKMKLSEIERIAKAAMDACSEVISHPKDSFVRQQLFDSLTEVVDPAFLETDQSRRDSFNRLLQQANVWGAIVRQRIYLFRRGGPGDTSAPLPLGIPPETFSTSSTTSSSSWEDCRCRGPARRNSSPWLSGPSTSPRADPRPSKPATGSMWPRGTSSTNCTRLLTGGRCSGRSCLEWESQRRPFLGRLSVDGPFSRTRGVGRWAAGPR
jgi:hypothetical protein